MNSNKTPATFVLSLKYIRGRPNESYILRGINKTIKTHLWFAVAGVPRWVFIKIELLWSDE